MTKQNISTRKTERKYMSKLITVLLSVGKFLASASVLIAFVHVTNSLVGVVSNFFQLIAIAISVSLGFVVIRLLSV